MKKAKNIVAWIDKYVSKEKSEKCFFTIESIEKLSVLTFEFLIISRVHIPVEKIV